MHRSEVTLFRTALLVATIVATRLATMSLDFTPAVGLNDKVLHVGAFLVLASLLDFSFPRNAFGTAKTATLLGYGMTIEVVQHFLPYRTFSLLDWAADAVGVVLYLAIAVPILKRTPWLQRRWAPQVSQ